MRGEQPVSEVGQRLGQRRAIVCPSSSTGHTIPGPLTVLHPHDAVLKVACGVGRGDWHALDNLQSTG